MNIYDDVWTSVEAECDCPHDLEVWRVFVSKKMHDIDTVGEAKDEVDGAVDEHISENEYCSMETVTVTVYYEEEL